MSADEHAEEHADGTGGGLILRVEQERVSDTEVAAATVAVAALLTGSAGPTPPPAVPAWRRAGMWEASTARRIRTPAELGEAEAR